MRILHITPQYHPCVGGAENYTKELSERLVRRGHDVMVLTMNDPPAKGRRNATIELLNGVTIRRFDPVGRLHGLLSIGASTRMASACCGRWFDPTP